MGGRLKVAILADIHGNTLALKNVLEDAESIGVDGYWFLGDYAAIGYDPVGVLKRITHLPNARFIHGNTDRYLVTGELPWMQLDAAIKDLAHARTHVQVARSFAWTTGAIGTTGWLSWFKVLPLDFRFTLPDGTRVLAVHAAPGTDDGMGININTPEEELYALVEKSEAELVLVGHTHLPFDRIAGNIRVVNPGSVSNPFPPDLRACYAVLEADERGYTIQHRRVDYDHEAVIKAVQEVNHPALDYIERFMRGENRKDWMK
jgi:predicted phosphodiesterase